MAWSTTAPNVSRLLKIDGSIKWYQTMKNYSTHQIAEYSGVCVNTVRNYEKLGFISKSKRADNGYRIFTDIHKMQMTICRLIFSPPYVNSVIRKASIEVIYASGKEDFVLCKELTEKYIDVINNELQKANNAVKALTDFCMPEVEDVFYDRKEASIIIGTSVETIRNWERNGLIISVKKGKKRVYGKTEIAFMRIIYILLSGGFTLQKIYNSLKFLRNTDNEHAIEALYNSSEYMYLEVIEKNIIERIKEALNSAYNIRTLLIENF